MSIYLTARGRQEFNAVQSRTLYKQYYSASDSPDIVFNASACFDTDEHNRRCIHVSVVEKNCSPLDVAYIFDAHGKLTAETEWNIKGYANQRRAGETGYILMKFVTDCLVAGYLRSKTDFDFDREEI